MRKVVSRLNSQQGVLSSFCGKEVQIEKREVQRCTSDCRSYAVLGSQTVETANVILDVLDPTTRRHRQSSKGVRQPFEI